MSGRAVVRILMDWVRENVPCPGQLSTIPLATVGNRKCKASRRSFCKQGWKGGEGRFPFRNFLPPSLPSLRLWNINLGTEEGRKEDTPRELRFPLPPLLCLIYQVIFRARHLNLGWCLSLSNVASIQVPGGPIKQTNFFTFRTRLKSKVYQISDK